MKRLNVMVNAGRGRCLGRLVRGRSPGGKLNQFAYTLKHEGKRYRLNYYR